MRELTRPFLNLWKWVDDVGGYPGQLFFCVLVVMLIIGFLTWYGNKK
jgi:hypothetical protein